MIFYKKILTVITSLILVVILSLSLKPYNESIYTSANENFKPTIILDAGHGGFDGGAVADDGTVEKDINLSISKKLYEMLKLAGFNVIMTRNTDSATDNTDSVIISERKKSDLKERLRIINENPDSVFVSIHLNKYTTSTASGAQVFYSPNNENSSKLGQSIQSAIISLLQTENTRTIKKGTKSTYLLHNAKIPSVIVECGFLSNNNELNLLKKDDYQSQMAFAIFSGIQEYYNLERGTNGREV